MADAGFAHCRVGDPADTFAGAGGEEKARTFGVLGYPFLAQRLGG